MNTTAICHTLRAARTRHLNVSTLHTLAYLSDKGGIVRMTEIAKELDVSTAGITGTIDRLEKLHYVRRAHSVTDRRVIHIQLTPTGRDALETCLQANTPAPTLGLSYTR